MYYFLSMNLALVFAIMTILVVILFVFTRLLKYVRHIIANAKSKKIYVEDFSEIQKILTHECLVKSDNNILVLFDVDETMITMRDKFLRPSARKDCAHIFYDVCTPITDPDKALKFSTLIAHAKTELVDHKIPNTIKSLQDYHIIVLGLTRMIPGAGKCGIIDAMEDFRQNELLDVGIDLSNKYLPNYIDLNFESKNNRKPIYKNGIIYAMPYSKGEVLSKILKNHMSHLNIKKIYFIDDSEHQINDIFDTCYGLGIECVCIHYVDKKINNETYDKEFGEYQFDCLKKHNTWLDDSKHEMFLKLKNKSK